MKKENVLKIYLVIIIAHFIWSAINFNDTYMWIGNSLVAITYTLGFALTYKRFKFTLFSYTLIFIHVIVIIVAAKYTYEFNPLFEWIKDVLGLSRNYYDRVGHFLQGFIPVMLTREFILRKGYMKKSKFFIIVLLFFTLGMSGAWELMEFVGAHIFNKVDVYTVTMQGDFWDAQWDMTLCTIGAILALITLSKLQDKYIEQEDAK